MYFRSAYLFGFLFFAFSGSYVLTQVTIDVSKSRVNSLFGLKSHTLARLPRG
jgi:hypothetical protein